MESKDRADYRQPIFSKYLEEFGLVDDIWEMLSTQEKLREYLPRRGRGDSIESDESYLLRLQTTSLPRAFRDGIERSVGRFGVAQLSEDTPNPIKAIEANFDGVGNNLDTVVFRVLTMLLKYGSVAGVVDFVDGQPRFTLVPVKSIRNREVKDDVVKRLTVEHMEYAPEGYGSKKVYQYKEYTPGALIVHSKDKEEGDLTTEPPTLLTNARAEAREEVYAVWFCVDPSWPAWVPCPAPFLNLGKDCIKQMHKVSELDRAETICNMQVLKRYHPKGVDPNGNHPDIAWDPEIVIEIPEGGDVKVDEPAGTAISITHERNKDRQAAMDRAVDSWLMEKIRTATESALADVAERSRLEIVSKSLQNGFGKVFRFMMMLSDRRFNPETDDPGSLILTATAHSQVTDQEIAMATQDFQTGALSMSAIQKIKLQQWRSRGYDLDESDLTPDPAALNQVLENVQ